jgi:membrane fusion protein, multidrug efflux system
MHLKFSYVLAFGLAVGIGAWMYTGTVVTSGQANSANATPPPAERQAPAADAPFKVQVVTMSASQRNAVLDVRGRTEANAKVQVRSETAARVVERPAQEGSRVAVGDVLCKLAKGTRQASLLEAKAQLAQAELDHSASQELSTKGFSAQTTVAAAQAALDAARARLEEAKLELERTTILAPIDGIIESPMANIGARLNVGDICATVVDTDPMTAIGQVSEVDIAKVELGMPAIVDLITGEKLEGKVRYIAPAADTDTRTFRIEVELPNADGKARDGVTALTHLPLASEKAHKITPAILTLNDAGQVGLRTVTQDNITKFYPVTVLGGDTDGIWVSGLPDTVTVITVGQDYVTDGQTVEPVYETAEVSQ